MNEVKRITPGQSEGPFNIEAEQQVIGTLLLHNDVLSRIPDLEQKHFYDPVHGIIFAAIHARVMDGRLASPVSIKTEVEHCLSEVGGASYLVRMAGASMGAAAIREYARDLRMLWAKRELARVTGEALERASRGDGGEPGEIATALETDLAKIQQAAAVRPTSGSMLSAMVKSINGLSEAYQGGTGLTGISTGLESLDSVIGGLAPGRCYILAGRPAMGKSALALSIAAKAALRGEGVFFASLEMPDWELSNRFLSQFLANQGERVKYSDMERGLVSEPQFRAVVQAAKLNESLPLEIGYPEVRSTAKVRSAVRRSQARFGDNLKLVVIDYLQKLQPPGNMREFDRISAASEFCKFLAVEFNVPVVALAQLSRAVETRENKRPMLSDLRGSGEIEQDADVVMFAYRDAYYLEQQRKSETDSEKRLNIIGKLEQAQNDLEIIVAKQRGGGLGTARAHFEPEVNLIRDRIAEPVQEGWEI